MFDAYEPLRNNIAKCNLEISLEYIWEYFRGQSVNLSQPNKTPFPWEMSLLAREIILNCSSSGDKKIGGYIQKIINQIRYTENIAIKDQLNQSNVFFEMHRIVHRQFPWQIRNDMNVFIRCYKIFGERHVEDVLIRETGLTMRKLYVMGLAVSGHLLEYPGINSEQDYSSFGIDNQSTSTFFKKISTDIVSLRQRTKEVQSYDNQWAYTLNPLEGTPLVCIDLKHPNRLHCPIPQFLMQRITRGIFYDLINATDFGNPYGLAFQEYIGEVISERFPNSQYTLMAESEYKIGKKRKDGVDWILSDFSANTFIECKTKRLNLEAKTSLNYDVLEKQLEVLAEAIVQLYKNIKDAIAGHSNWTINDLPIYPVLVTLEDWYMSNPSTIEVLNLDIIEKLSELNICLSVLERMPYTIVSTNDFEAISHVIAAVGIQKFFALKTSSEYQHWTLIPFASHHFPEQFKINPPLLFEADLARILPEATDFHREGV